MIRRAICPGSFDPVTLGHLDIFMRAAAMFDELFVAIGTNSTKNALFSPPERIEMITEAVRHQPNITVVELSGLLVDFCRRNDVSAVIKGVRNGTDFDYELPMAHMNHSMSGIETVLLPTAAQWSFVSSTLVREVSKFGGDVSAYVPQVVLSRIAERLAGEKKENDEYC